MAEVKVPAPAEADMPCGDSNSKFSKLTGKDSGLGNTIHRQPSLCNKRLSCIAHFRLLTLETNFVRKECL